jgi:two-component system NarL family sensor kinase
MINKDIVFAIICSTLLILLLISTVVIVFYVSAKKNIKQEMDLAKTKLSFEKELRQVESEVSEYIKSQFAQELHDNIGQLLTAMHIQIENQKIDHPQQSESLKPIEIYLDEVTQQLRLLSRTLNNDYIGHIGLLAAMQLEVERLRSLKRFQVHWPMIQGGTNLNKNQELMVFRIFQEIIQNALRHSAAKNLYITIDNQNNHFEMNVRDDGKGFIPDHVLKSQKASGLRNITKRAQLAGLECHISSSPGNGCLFTLKKIILK